ncbi:hypothetical protein Pla110_42670 [Polystyrenella longa]|uniref:Uncharacterized protein n=1 Tax=Polystyrenella longa TaxID=2528007 RepID=A0A518CTF5_9PLAN|nr:polymorphic toxin-type HINT domain-containing protein [Polystyrenella longa]QDU82509.1 hypothetical protein Pla110_42670 [Polystyrenella longa]
MTLGGTRYVRTSVYNGEDHVDYNSGVYVAGNVIGIAMGMVISGGSSSCSTGWGYSFARGYQKFQNLATLAGAVTKIASGEQLSLLDVLSFSSPVFSRGIGKFFKGCFVGDTLVAYPQELLHSHTTAITLEEDDWAPLLPFVTVIGASALGAHLLRREAKKRQQTAVITRQTPKRLPSPTLETVPEIKEENSLPVDDIFAEVDFMHEDHIPEETSVRRSTTMLKSAGWQPADVEPPTSSSLLPGWLFNSLAAILLLLGCTASVLCFWPGSNSSAKQVQASVAPSSPQYTTGHKRIDEITPGFKVWAENPTDEQDYEFGADVDPQTWKLLTLKIIQEDSSQTDIQLLRPAEWLTLQDAETGKTIPLFIPELGIDSEAEVLNIEACPEIPSGPGRVVTATFRHSGKEVLDVKIASEAAAIGATPKHPFWSEDRQEFVRADELREGEEVVTLHGTSHVESITPRAGPHTVYNLEVQVDHVYHVGTGGVLVHNACHGNSRLSNKLQYGYVIYDRGTGTPLKIGITSGRLARNGTTYRANSQVNKLNRAGGNYKTLTIEATMGRKNILDWESGMVDYYRSVLLHELPGNLRP